MSVLRYAGVFVVVVAVILGGAAAAPMVTSDGTDRVDVSNEQFQPSQSLAPTAPEDGQIRMESSGESKTVVIDNAHGNDFSRGELQTLVATLVENGHEVRYFQGREQSLNQSLRSADAYVVVNPRQPYKPQEIAGVEAFADAGGRVLMLSDPPQSQIRGGLLFASIQRVGYKHTSVGSSLGVTFGTDYLYNMQENQNNFKSIYATAEGDAGVTQGVDRVVMREATTVVHDGGTVGLVGTEGTTLSSTRDAGTYPTLVQKGNVVAVGDTDFLHTEDAYDADNEVLIGNLADYLVTGDKEPGAPEKPGQARRPGGPQRPPTDGAPTRTPTP